MCQQKVYPLQPLFPRTTLDKALNFAGCYETQFCTIETATSMNAKDRQLALALKNKDIEIERIKQERDDQIEQIKGKTLADKREPDKKIALAEKSAARQCPK